MNQFIKNKKGLVLFILLVIIIGALVVGGGVVYFATKTPTSPKNIEDNNYQLQKSQNSLNNVNDNQVKNTETTSTTVENQPIADYEIKNIKEFISTAEYIHNPTWSPDGKWIAFSDTYLGRMYIKNINDNTQKLLTDDNGSIRDYSWSPDSKAIAYLSEEILNGNFINTIKLVEIDSGKITELATDGPMSDPHFTSLNEIIYSHKGTLIKRKWNGISVGAEEVIAKNVPAHSIESSPIEDKLIIGSGERLDIMDSTGGNVKTIAKKNAGLPIYIQVSPDGSKVLYFYNSLFVYDINSYKITDLGSRAEFPQWLPNGKIIYCISEDDGHSVLSSEIYIINADGSNKTRVTNTADQIEMDIAVSPDGKLIVYRDEKSKKIYLGELK